MNLFNIFTNFFTAIIIYASAVYSAPVVCNEPSNLQQRFNTLNHGLDYRTLFFTSGWSQDTLDIDFRDLVFQGIDYTQAACPATFLKGNFPLMLRASCPWYLEKERKEDRFPKELYKAYSKCTSCIGSNGQQSCTRIYHQIKTLKRTGCQNNEYQYEEQNEGIPIAYVCAQQREVVNSIQISTTPAADEPDLM